MEAMLIALKLDGHPSHAIGGRIGLSSYQVLEKVKALIRAGRLPSAAPKRIGWGLTPEQDASLRLHLAAGGYADGWARANAVSPKRVRGYCEANKIRRAGCDVPDKPIMPPRPPGDRWAAQPPGHPSTWGILNAGPWPYA